MQRSPHPSTSTTTTPPEDPTTPSPVSQSTLRSEILRLQNYPPLSHKRKRGRLASTLANCNCGHDGHGRQARDVRHERLPRGSSNYSHGKDSSSNLQSVLLSLASLWELRLAFRSELMAVCTRVTIRHQTFIENRRTVMEDGAEGHTWLTCCSYYCSIGVYQHVYA